MRIRPEISVLPLALLLAACGGSSQKGPNGGGLMDKTFAGQNACNPQNHDRPFIINWDATDQSSFQAHAQSDVVFVHYEGCDLKVLDACRDDSMKGSIGAYKQVEWTSGGVESIDIHDKGELYAKLPLGAISLGGRVESGEKLHMEYYVSGTRTATRDKFYRSDLKSVKGCEGATHFVYAFNLGAFAIASASALKAEVNGSYFGFGGGGSKESETIADKKGGDLASCKGVSSKEDEACKVPIRLALRPIVDADNPDIAASKAPDTDASLNAAGKLKAEGDAAKAAKAHLDAAVTKSNVKDGPGCLAELDQHDKLDPGALSTNPSSFLPATTRGQCLMLAGQCDAGKLLFRKAYSTQYPQVGPDQLDTIVDGYASMSCQGGKLSEKDQLLKAKSDLTNAGYDPSKKMSVAGCQGALDTYLKLFKKVKPYGDSDPDFMKALNDVQAAGPQCFATAGDCGASFKAFTAVNDARAATDKVKVPAAMARPMFDATVATCKGK
jgi:hypothetical protein